MLYSKRKRLLRLLYQIKDQIKAVFLAPDGATEKHSKIVNAFFKYVYDKKLCDSCVMNRMVHCARKQERQPEGRPFS